MAVSEASVVRAMGDDTVESQTEIKQIGDIHNCCGSTVVQVIYPTNANTAKQKN